MNKIKMMLTLKKIYLIIKLIIENLIYLLMLKVLLTITHVKQQDFLMIFRKKIN
jgi:hypothetical protein